MFVVNRLFGEMSSKVIYCDIEFQKFKDELSGKFIRRRNSLSFGIDG
jgi:hypothetical protein